MLETAMLAAHHRVDCQQVVPGHVPRETVNSALAQPGSEVRRGGWLSDRLSEPRGEVVYVARLGVHAKVAQNLAGHRRAERDGGKPDRHVVQELAIAFGL